MKNHGSAGDIMTFVAPSGGVTAGVPVIIEETFCVPISDADAGDEFAAAVTGIIQDLDKVTGFGAKAGSLAYWNMTSENVTDDEADILIGVFAADCESADEACDVRLNGVSVSIPAEPVSGQQTYSTGTVTLTGSNNASGMPKTYTLILGRLAEGSTIDSVAIFDMLADGEGIGISGANFQFGYTNGNTIQDLVGSSIDAPTEDVNIEDLDPVYEATGAGCVVLHVSGLAGGSSITFSGQVLVTPA